MGPDRQRQLELEAEAELELEQERSQDSSNPLSSTIAPPFAGGGHAGLGPDYSQTMDENMFKGAGDSIDNTINFVGDTFNAATTPAPEDENNPWWMRAMDFGINPAWEAGKGLYRTAAKDPERAADTVGMLAGGTAGAATGATMGAAGGALLGPLAPVTAPLGGILGGAVGFGLGSMGYDMSSDLLSDAVNSFLPGSEKPTYTRPLDEYLKDMSYNIGGGLATGGAAELGFQGVPAGYRAAKKPFTQAHADARVGQHLSDILGPDYPQQIDQAYASQDPSNTLYENRSLGELLGNEQLKHEQKVLESSGGGYGPAAKARISRNDAQLRWLDDIERSPGSAQDVADAVGESRTNLVDAAQRKLLAEEDNVRGKVSNLPESIPLDAAGRQIRAGVELKNQEMGGKVTEAFQGIGEGQVDPRGFIQEIKSQEMPKYFREVGKQPDQRLINLVESLTKEGEQVLGKDELPLLDANGNPLMRDPVYTMQDVQAARSEATNIAETSDARSGAIANKIKDALDLAVQDAVERGAVTPEEAASWQEGIKARKEQGDLLESSATPAKAVLAEQAYGRLRLNDTEVPGKYFRPGDKGVKEGIQNYKQTVGDTDAALEPLYRYATDQFRQSGAVKPDGLIDSAAAKRWLNRHKAALDELPALRDQLSDLHSAQQFLNEKFGDLKRTQAEFESGALKSWLGDIDPNAAIERMLSGTNRVKNTSELVRHLQVNDPAALAGLRRGVIEYIKQKTFIPTEAGGTAEALASGKTFQGEVKGGTLANLLTTLKPALQKMFTESQLKGFDQLYSDKRSQLSVDSAKPRAVSPTASFTNTLSTLIRAGSSGYLRGIPYVGRWLAVVEPILKQIPGQKYMAKLEEALLNPRIARDLQNKSSAKNLTKSISEIFSEEIAAALGTSSPAAYAASVDARKQKPSVQKQQSVTSNELFPKREKLQTPPTSGKMSKISLSEILSPFSASTAEASDNLTIDDINRANARMKSNSGGVDLSSYSPETRARISVESSGNPEAVSPKGAQGLSQLMPSTGRWIAQKLGEQYNPLTKNMTAEERQASIEQNIRFGDWYFHKLEQDFGNKTLARAAYNAGPGRVRAAMKAAGTTDVNAILRSLPAGVQKETLPYVDKIAQRYGR